MGSKMKKINKLLLKARELRIELLDDPTSKKYARVLRKCLSFGKKAVALSRDECRSGSADQSCLISSLYSLAATAYISGTSECDAPALLEEARSAKGFDDSNCFMQVNSYYGSMLCSRRDYDQAAEVFSEVFKRLGENGALVSRSRDELHPLIEACKNAGCAFTYAKKAYDPVYFRQPLIYLLSIQQGGCSVEPDAIRQAAYFSACQMMYESCFQAITDADEKTLMETAELCIDKNQDDDEVDFFSLAAMRLICQALARDLMFKDCEQACERLLELCSRPSVGCIRTEFGSAQDIAADINLLLGIMHYRVSNYDRAIQHFDAANAALEADARGVPLASAGYVEFESIAAVYPSAEKASFACKYRGLSLWALKGKDSLPECADMLLKSLKYTAELPQEPYFSLRAASDYNMLAKIYRQSGDGKKAASYDLLSKKHVALAISKLKESGEDSALYSEYMERLRVRKRLSLKRGLLEQYAECLNCEIILCEPPYAQADPSKLAELYYQLAQYCRIVEKFSFSVEYFDKATEYLTATGEISDSGKRLYSKILLFKSAALVKTGESERACAVFKKFVDTERELVSDETEDNFCVRVARLSYSVGLPPVDCAEYLNHAAAKVAEVGGDSYTSALLYNQAGTCLYRSLSDGNVESERRRIIAVKELSAFENAYRELSKCGDKAMDLKSAVLVNIGECIVRRGEPEKGVEYYNQAMESYEKYFDDESFARQSDEDKNQIRTQYGLCCKSVGEIYRDLGGDAYDVSDSASNIVSTEFFNKSIEALTKAIQTFSRIGSEEAVYYLAACLNARGCIYYYLDKYTEEIHDITQAINLRSSADKQEVGVAVMLKNRAYAYKAMGDYNAMYSDLVKSIDTLDNLDDPPEELDSIYGEHLMALGLCQEELQRDDGAADSYKKAIQHLNATSDDSDADNVGMRALCHFRRANCLCRRVEHEYYGALTEYDRAINLLDSLPPSESKNERLKVALTLRGELYEVFREPELAKMDYLRRDSLAGELKSGCVEIGRQLPEA